MSWKIIIAVTTVVLVVCAGCQSQMENKKAAQERYNKTSAQMKLTMAQQQYDQGDYDQAAKTVQQCLSANPDNPGAYLLHGKLLLAKDQRDDAIEQLGLVLQHDKKLHEGWYWLGVAAQENGYYEKAREYYEKALLLEPTNVDYILAVADVLVAQGDCPEAIRLLTDKMAALPGDVSLKTASAELMWRAGKNEQAIELFKQVMLMTGNNSHIAEMLGYCYVFSSKWNQAADVFNKLLEQCTDDREKQLYLQMMALCSMNCGQYDRAISCYDKLTVIERNNADIWVKLGQASLGTGAAGRAFMCGQKALALQPGLPDAVALIGCAQYASGDYANAAKSFEKITADKKNAGLAWLMRARCYQQLGQNRRAEDAYKKAVETNPRSELGNFLAKGKDGKLEK